MAHSRRCAARCASPRRARLAGCAAVALLLAATVVRAGATTYYVRQTVGDDAHDGRSAATAWCTLARLSTILKAGDTVYVGPGLYREQVTVGADGTSGARIVFAADASGEHTGDPPGTVMITGADPVDTGLFVPVGPPGVYRATLPQHVLGVVEMDGSQRRYRRARDTLEHLVDKLDETEVVTRLRGSHLYDEEHHELLLHTSDDREPRAHEIELMHRGTGIGMFGKHFVTIVGFTFRHFGDAGINFFKGSGDGIALDNVSYGGRQGIRVYDATNILIAGNTLFRNDNSGVYFAAQSTGGVTSGNVAYENQKGVRWSSQSSYGMALDDVVFDNAEAGIAMEDVVGTVLRRNRLVQNPKAQLMLIRSVYDGDADCFEGPTQATADFVFQEHYATLADVQRAKGLDLRARAGGCGALPTKIDVHKLHAETVAYAERARALLAGGVPAVRSTAAPAGSTWWGALFGR
ncbi:MAG TPA: right-handed parallel beta-helix repeat-containing protein [Candidatus Binatia bacterium]|jgi:parallel beta-helix repeat protein